MNDDPVKGPQEADAILDRPAPLLNSLNPWHSVPPQIADAFRPRAVGSCGVFLPAVYLVAYKLRGIIQFQLYLSGLVSDVEYVVADVAAHGCRGVLANPKSSP